MPRNEEQHPSAPAGPEEPIQPIDFTPPEAARRRWRPRLSPARVAVAAAALVFAGAAWFVLTAKSVFIDTDPVGSEIEIDNALALQVGPRYLMREGPAEVTLSAPGYHELSTTIEVGQAQSQTFRLALTRLPGFLDLTTRPVDGARVLVDGREVGSTPLEGLELPAGRHRLRVERDRYQAVETEVDIEGRSVEQTLAVELLPAWGTITFESTPAGATVYVDGEERGRTPLSADILEGEREVLVKLPAHKAWTRRLTVEARQDSILPPIELEAADGLVLLQSTPSNAGVMLDDTYQGRTPLEVAVPPGRDHQLTFFHNGYKEARRTIQTEPDQEASLHVELEPETNRVEITARPAGAQLYVDGKHMGEANQSLELLAASQEIEIRRDGYVPFTTTFVSRPGLQQKLDVELKTLEQHRRENTPTELTSAGGQTLKLLRPAAFTMGASRREAGRQANEMLREVELTRPFYLSTTEVTNAEFRRFDPEHSSGVVEGRSLTLSNNNQPVVRVSWEQAARYCNWLSEQESLPPFYQVEDGKVVGFNPDSHGYRLPTEAEWAWAARVDDDPKSLLKFPWGAELPPPSNHGNYADLSAARILGRVISDYNDSFAASAPVASFPANANGFYDMGGNVAEWTHDYYGSSASLMGAAETDPLGPDQGRYHVIRGSSWAHSTVTELRLSYRDYGDEPRDDVGFRVARYLEE